MTFRLMFTEEQVLQLERCMEEMAFEKNRARAIAQILSTRGSTFADHINRVQEAHGNPWRSFGTALRHILYEKGFREGTDDRESNMHVVTDPAGRIVGIYLLGNPWEEINGQPRFRNASAEHITWCGRPAMPKGRSLNMEW